MALFVGSKCCHAVRCKASCTCYCILRVMPSSSLVTKLLLTHFQKGIACALVLMAFFWSANVKAARVRLELGFGTLRPIWIRSHLGIDVAIKQGMDPMHCAINHLADHLASRAADVSQLPADDIKLRADESSLVLNILP